MAFNTAGKSVLGKSDTASWLEEVPFGEMGLKSRENCPVTYGLRVEQGSGNRKEDSVIPSIYLALMRGWDHAK